MRKIRTTLLYIIKDNKILLAEKKRGFGVGKLNGVGGKIENDESIEQAMLRETMEEIGVKPIDFEQRAIIHFDLFYKGEKEKEDTYVFVASNYIGELIETEEMKPKWFELKNLPFEKMFSDDRLWLNSLIEGKKFEANIILDENFNTTDFNIKYIK